MSILLEKEKPNKIRGTQDQSKYMMTIRVSKKNYSKMLELGNKTSNPMGTTFNDILDFIMHKANLD